MDEHDEGWFAFNPGDPDSIARLTPQQRDAVRRHTERGDLFPEPIGEVQVLIHDLAPGQAEIRYSGPADVPPAHFLRVAIRELQRAMEGHEGD